MDLEERRHFPGGWCEGYVPEHELVHQSGDEEGREDAGRAAASAADGEIDRWTEDGGDHDVPAAAPEVGEGGGEVRRVELRLQLEAPREEERRDDGGCGENQLEGEVQVKRVNGEEQVRMDRVFESVTGDENGEKGGLGGGGEEKGGGGRVFKFLWRLLVDQLDGEGGGGEEGEEGKVGGERTGAGGEEEELEQSEPGEEEGGDAAEVNGGEVQGEEREEADHREEE